MPTPASLTKLHTSLVPLVTIDLVGIAALRQLIAGAPARREQGRPRTAAADRADLAPSERRGVDDLVDGLGQPGHGAILVTAKGGVGKTTVARLIAIELARRGHSVHLSTTDPAGHAARELGGLATLTTSAIDPTAATHDYVQGRLDAATRDGLGQDGLDLLAEDLRSPCSEEVAVFQAFRQLLRRARNEFVVIETTPVAEATDLQSDLRRAGIEPFGWVVNATITGSNTTDPTLSPRADLERDQFGPHQCGRRPALGRPLGADVGQQHRRRLVLMLPLERTAMNAS